MSTKYKRVFFAAAVVLVLQKREKKVPETYVDAFASMPELISCSLFSTS